MRVEQLLYFTSRVLIPSDEYIADNVGRPEGYLRQQICLGVIISMVILYAHDAQGHERTTLDLSHISHVKGCDRATLDLSHRPLIIEYISPGIDLAPS